MRAYLDLVADDAFPDGRAAGCESPFKFCFEAIFLNSVQ